MQKNLFSQIIHVRVNNSETLDNLYVSNNLECLNKLWRIFMMTYIYVFKVLFTYKNMKGATDS